MVAADEMVVLDRWAVGCALKAQQEIVEAYENYDFHLVTQKLMQFCSVEMGSFYLDIIKDRQYTAKADSLARRSCQSALFLIAEAMVRWMAPIMSFTADEIWKLLPGERAQFVFTEEWFDGLFGLKEGEALDEAYWAELLLVRGEVNKALETARADKRIGSSLQAEVTLYAEPALAEKLTRLGEELRFVLITSQAKVEAVTAAPADAQATELAGLWLNVTATEAAKCERCWHHVADVGTIAGHEGICGRCVTNIDGDGETRAFA